MRRNNSIETGCQPVHHNEALFEERYIRLRCRENRLYTNEELSCLPLISSSHPHHGEWLTRQRSCTKLKDHLGKRRQPLKILEVGCGNGWLSYQLSSLPFSIVIGIDINFTELKQAAAVFSESLNLHFIYGDIRSGLFAEASFDSIVFAASIQYFPSLDEIISAALPLLKPSGEVHILDTAFYKTAQAAEARERSLQYYQRIGCPEMTDYYFHHAFPDLARFQYSILSKPSLFARVLSGTRHPFPWICIKEEPVT